jgi:hypothetical protein
MPALASTTYSVPADLPGKAGAQSALVRDGNAAEFAERGVLRRLRPMPIAHLPEIFS